MEIQSLTPWLLFVELRSYLYESKVSALDISRVTLSLTIQNYYSLRMMRCNRFVIFQYDKSLSK